MSTTINGHPSVVQRHGPIQRSRREEKKLSFTKKTVCVQGSTLVVRAMLPEVYNLLDGSLRRLLQEELRCASVASRKFVRKLQTIIIPTGLK